MVESLGFIKIFNVITDDKQRVIVSNALHQDKFIRRCLNEKDLIENILNKPPRNLSDWSPAAIGLRALNNPPSLEFLMEEPLEKLPIELAEYSARLFSSWRDRSYFDSINLNHIIHLAFHLRELKILTTNWQFLGQKLESISEVVLPTIVCLLGIIPDKLELLIELSKSWGNKFHSHLPLYCLLCNPQTNDVFLEILRQLFTELDIDTKILYLYQLVSSRPNLANQLSKELTSQLTINSNNQLETHSWQLSQLNQKINLALIFSVNTNNQKNFNYWQDVLSLSKELQANVIVRMAINYLSSKFNYKQPDKEDKDLINQLDVSIDLWRKAIELSPDQPTFIAALMISLVMAGRISEAKDWAKKYGIIESDELSVAANNINHNSNPLVTSPKNNGNPNKYPLRKHPALLVSTAIVEFNLGEIDSSKSLSDKAIRIMNENGEFSLLLNPIDLITPFLRLMLKLKLHRLCLQLANNIATLDSTDTDLLLLIASIYSALNLHHKAIQYLYSLIQRYPNNTKLHRMYLHNLEAAGEWNLAYKLRNRSIEGSNELSRTELLNYAYVALKAMQPNETNKICDNLLSNSADDPIDESNMVIIYWLKGLSEIQRGEKVSGIDLLYQAKNLGPNSPFPYKALAELYNSLNKEEQAKIVLQEAATNIPNSYLIQYEIGDYYLSRGAPALALNHLESSYKLLNQTTSTDDSHDKQTDTIPSWERENGNYNVIKHLCKTLINLGYIERACEIISGEYAFIEDKLDNDPEFLYIYAHSLVNLGKSDLAIPYLNKIVIQYPNYYDAQLDLAKAIIQNTTDPKDLKFALTLLNSIEKGPKAYDKADNLGHTLDSNTLRQREIEVIALKAESLKSIGDYTKARDAYRNALKITNPADSQLKSRLSLGLGDIALELGEIETAIAAFQDGIKSDPKNYILLRKLSKAYLTSGLIDSSLQSAISAHQLNSDNFENVLWFVDHCLEVYEKSQCSKPEAKSLALQALDQAIEFFPSKADLLIRRGQIESKNNNRKNAIKSFVEVSKLPNLKPVDFREAAKNLEELGEFDAAIKLYEKALNSLPTESNKNLKIFSNQRLESSQAIQSEISSKTEIIIKLANSYIHTDQKHKAINIIEQELKKEPNNLELNIEKAKLLNILDQPEQAIECINDNLLRNPSNYALHITAADLYKSNGKLIQALFHADKVVELINHEQNSQITVEAYIKAAEIAFQLLLFKQARKYLSIPETKDVPDSYQVLLAEISFILNDLDLTEKVVLDFANNNLDDPYWCSVVARFSLRKHGTENEIAVNIPSNNSQQINIDNFPAHEIIKNLGLCMSATELGKWKDGLSIINNAINNYPDVPIIHYTYIKILITLVRAQKLSEFLDIQSHAPGQENLPSDYFNIFSKEISELEQLLENSPTNFSGIKALLTNISPVLGNDFNNSFNLNEAIHNINDIKILGLAVLQPRSENIESLRIKIADGCNDPEIISAWIFAQNKNIKQETIDQISRSHPTNPEIWLYLSIVQSNEIPSLSYTYAKEALDNSKNQINSWFVGKPILYRLLSKYSFLIEEFDVALDYLRKALTIWSNEPIWHFLASEYILKQNETSYIEAIHHLKQAINIDANNTKYYLKLAEVYKNQGNIDQAIQALTDASNKIIDDPEIWLSLSKAYYEINDNDKASTCAERVSRISNNKDHLIEANNLRGQIEIRKENPEGALDFADRIFELSPENPSAYVLVANANIKLRQPTKASIALEKAITKSDDPYELELELLNLLHEQSTLDKAITKTVELLDKYPQDPNLIAKSAKLLVEAGREDEAIVAAREALKHQSDRINNKERAKLHHIIGTQLKKQGQLDQAIDQLIQAINTCPDFLDPYIDLGKVYLDRRDYGNATKIFSMAMNQFPDNPMPYYHAGIALKENKDYIQAEKVLRKATELAPRDVSIQRMHGSIVVLNLIHNRRNPTSN